MPPDVVRMAVGDDADAPRLLRIEVDLAAGEADVRVALECMAKHPTEEPNVRTGYANQRTGPGPAKWQAANCPGACSTSGGTSVLQIGNCAMGQRVWKTQPDGGLSGVGMSPLSRIRLFFSDGSGIGTAESSAFVYGCSGLS